MKFAGEAQVLECAGIPTHRDDASTESHRPDGFIQGGRCAGDFNHNIRSAVIRQRPDLLGDGLPWINDNMRAAAHRQRSTRIDSIHPDDQACTGTSRELGDEQTDDSQARYHDNIAKRRSGIKHPVQSCVQVGIQHAVLRIDALGHRDGANCCDHNHALVRRVAENHIAHRRRADVVPHRKDPTHIRVAVWERIAPFGNSRASKKLRRWVTAQFPLRSATAVDVHLRARADARKHRFDLYLVAAWSRYGNFTHLDHLRSCEDNSLRRRLGHA